MGTAVQILNITLICLFVAVLVGFVIAIIVGIVRGFWKSTFVLLSFGTLIAVALGTLNPLVEGIGAIDLTQFNLYVNLTGPSGEVLSIPATTIKQTLYESIETAMYLNGFTGSNYEISQTAWQLSTMILKYALLIVDFLLIAIFGSIFVWLLWICCFKHIVPLLARTRIKWRWVSAIEEAVSYVVVTSLFLAPLTSLVNVANNAWQSVDHDLSNETVVEVDKLMDTYNDSMFAKTFFNWTVDENGLTLDTRVLGTLTKTTVGDVSTSFIDTLANLGNVGSIMLDSIISASGGTPIDYGAILSQETLTKLFSSINKSQIFAYILPLAATVALNLDEVKAFINPELVDLSDIDWVESFTDIQTVVIDVVNSGVLDSFINPENNAPIDGNSEQAVDVEKIVNSMLTNKAFPYFTRVFETIDSNKLLSRVMPCLMLYVSDNFPEFADFLPQTWEEMNNIKWGSELNIVYENLYLLNKKAPELVSSLISMQGSTSDGSVPPVGPVPSEIRKAQEPDPNEIINLVIDNFDAVISSFVGEFDEHGDLINVDEKGHTIVYQNGHKIKNRHFTLMDSTLFSYLFPTLLNQVTAGLGNDFISPEIIETALAELNKDTPIKNFKSELGALLNAVKAIFSNAKLKDLIMSAAGGTTPEVKPVASDPTELLKDDELINTVVDLLPLFDKSIIFNKALKPFLKEQIKAQEEMFKQIGLSVEDFNFDVEEFATEIGALLKAMPNALFIVDALSNGGTDDPSLLFKTLSDNTDKIALLLDSVFESEIFNPSDIFDKSIKDATYDNNFFNILKYLFGGTPDSAIQIEGLVFDPHNITFSGNLPVANGSGKHKWTNTKTSAGDFVRDAYGRPIFDGETGYIANILTVLGITSKNTSSGYEGMTLLDAFTKTSDPSKLIGYLESDFKISKVFKVIDSSSIFSSLFGPFLDASLQGTGLLDDKTSFKNVKNWTTEGKNFALICDSIGELAVDLNNLDVTKIKDTAALNVMLHSLADSQIFENGSEYTFNSFLFDKMQTSLDTMINDPFADTKNQAMNDFGVKQDAAGGYISIADKNDWCDEAGWIKTFGGKTSKEVKDMIKANSNKEKFYNSDYIGNVCNLLDIMNKAIDETNTTHDPNFDIMGALSSGKLSADSLQELLLTLNKIQPVRMILYNAIAQVKTISAGGISLANLNAEFFATANETDRQNEIDSFVDFYRFLKDLVGDQDLASIDFNKIIADKNNMVKLGQKLTVLNSSQLFHAAGPGIDPATKQPAKTTVFQDLINAFVGSDAISKFIYSNKSIKDKTLYPMPELGLDEMAKGKAKAKILVLQNYPYPNNPEGSEFDLEKQRLETFKMLEVASCLLGGYKNIHNIEFVNVNGVETPKYVKGDTLIDVTPDDYYNGLPSTIEGEKGTLDFANMDASKISGTIVTDIFKTLNKSDLLYDLVPNALSFVFSSLSGDNDFSRSIAKADPFYVYQINGTNKFDNRYPDTSINPNDSKRSDANEFSHIGALIDGYQDIQKELSKLDSTSKDFSDLFKNGVTETTSGYIESMLDAMSNSFIFHKASIYDKAFDDINSNNGVVSNPGRKDSELTAFEGLLDTLIGVSGIKDLFGTTGNSLTKNIQLMSAIDIHHDVPHEGYSNNWTDEIHSMLSFIVDASSLIDSIPNFELDIANPAVAKVLSPDAVSNLLVDINRVNILDGTLQNLFANTLQTAGLSQFSTMDGKDLANYNLTPSEFGNKQYLIENDPSSVTFTGEIGNFHNLLSKLSHEELNPTTGLMEHVSYTTIKAAEGDDPMNAFVNSGFSSDIILEYLHDSNFYSKAVPGYGDKNNPSTVESIFFFNMLNKNGLSGYITGSSDNEKIAVINYLLTTDKLYTNGYQPVNEAKALDTLIKTATSLVGNNVDYASDINNIKLIAPIVEAGITSLTYDVGVSSIDGETIIDYYDYTRPHDRAYLSSELLANMLNQLMVVEEDNIRSEYNMNAGTPDANLALATFNKNIRYFKVNDNSESGLTDGFAYDYHNIGPKTYDLLNRFEGRAVKSILELYRGTELKPYVDLMLDPAQEAYYNKIFSDLVYNVDGHEVNSYVASIIYTSRINHPFSTAIGKVNELKDALVVGNQKWDEYINSLPEIARPEAQTHKPPILNLEIASYGPVLSENDLFAYKGGIEGMSFTEYGKALRKFVNVNGALILDAASGKLPAIPPELLG